MEERWVGVDCEGNKLQDGDTVVVTAGPHERLQGTLRDHTSDRAIVQTDTQRGRVVEYCFLRLVERKAGMMTQ